MLKWLFKKRGAAAVSAPPAPVAAPAPAEDRAASWKSKLDAALGDDGALLVVARSAPTLELKLAAVQALRGEEALKAAQREFRGHDRRAQQLASARLAACVSQRVSRAKAHALAEAAVALTGEDPLPLNRLAQLDRDWQALDAALLEPGQVERFAAARDALDVVLRERDARREQRRRDAAALAAAEPPAVAPPPPPPPSPPPPAAKPAPKPTPPRAELLSRLDTLLQEAEQTLAAGHSAALPPLLKALDAAGNAAAPLDDERHSRRQALGAEFARLRSWQQWGDARAVDTLVTAAEALAQAAAAASVPEAPRLPLDAHGAAIRELRARWKALDAQHAAAGAAQWQRFDAALLAAFAPIAAHQAELRAQRRDNLAARETLLAALDAVAIDPPETPDGLAEHWRMQIRALDQFRADWRTLGPPEHRVPRESRDVLRQRLERSTERIQAPLTQARAAAAAAREPLIEAAQALAQEVAAQPMLRDASARARALQADWARQARELPLAHAVETALWSRFRAAIDAVFAQRQAAAEAQQAALAADLAAREALLERLAAVGADTPASELRRVLAEADTAWRSSQPRSPALDARFGQAREALLGHLAGSTQRRWQGQCDTLAARVAWCEAREDGAADAALAPAALSALPRPWEHALSQRWAGAAGALPATAFDEVLLQLEAALDLPATPEQQAARRELKLRTMKAALEGRAQSAQGPAQQAGWLVDALRQGGTDAAQRARLRVIVAALRQAPAGALGSPLGKD